MRPFRAVVFDLDGTLADSLADIGGAMDVALAALGLPTHSLDAYRAMVGEGVGELVRRALGGDADPELQRRVLERYRSAYAEADHRRTHPYPGVDALLDGLRERQVPFAILSNKSHAFTQSLVERRFAGWRFEAVLGEREGVPRKPDPTAALELAALLGVAPVEIAFVGDTAVDMRTARAAGMIPVGVLWGFRGRDELLEHGARFLLDRPQQLLELEFARVG